MKKVILMLVAVFALTACSKDGNENNNSREDISKLIIGVWKPYKVEKGGKDITSDALALPCKEKYPPKIEFLNNGKAISYRAKENEQGECEPQKEMASYVIENKNIIKVKGERDMANKMKHTKPIIQKRFKKG